MNNVFSCVRLWALIPLVAAAALLSSESARTAVSLPPNLTPLPASDISLVANVSGTSTLRFATTSWNNGTGPLEIVAGDVDTGSGKQKVYQRIYLDDGTSFLNYAGSFTYHPEHHHIHFDDYALYTLQPLNAPGGSLRTGAKTTFCIIDTTKIDTTLPGAPKQPVYTTCGDVMQGMSVGWGDTYGSYLPGQEIDFTDDADGIYQLKIEVDPKKLLIESNESDNVSCVLLDIQKPNTVTVLDGSGSCSAVAAISPNSAAIDSTVQVMITGYGFSSDMAVSFAHGNGPRPVASNVQLVSDTDTLDTLTATVTVPYRRKGGHDPVWDLHVGDSVLRDAFTVTQ